MKTSGEESLKLFECDNGGERRRLEQEVCEDLGFGGSHCARGWVKQCVITVMDLVRENCRWLVMNFFVVQRVNEEVCGAWVSERVNE
jgi:hypothetical protein